MIENKWKRGRHWTILKCGSNAAELVFRESLFSKLCKSRFKILLFSTNMLLQQVVANKLIANSKYCCNLNCRQLWLIKWLCIGPLFGKRESEQSTDYISRRKWHWKADKQVDELKQQITCCRKSPPFCCCCSLSH